MLWRGV
ncbi:hypothetical protein ECEC1865_6388, partial [Escherichia coli EC1865]